MGDNSQLKGADYVEILPYVDTAWADAFLNGQLVYADDWANATDAQKLKALIQATREIDEIEYVGVKITITDAREWPRHTNISDISDNFYLDSEIPPDVGKATALQAAYIVKNHLVGHAHKDRQDHIMQGLTNMSRVGGQEGYDLTKARRHQLCREAYDLMCPYIAKTATLE